MSKRLEVGDNVVCIEPSRYDEFDNYYFKTVVSVTDKRAKLSSTEALLREPNKHNKYALYGKSPFFGEWQLLTEEIKAKEEAKNQIVKAFSNYEIIENGEISRTKLRKIVFSDEDMKKKLESILHPLIKNEIIKLVIKKN